MAVLQPWAKGLNRLSMSWIASRLILAGSAAFVVIGHGAACTSETVQDASGAVGEGAQDKPVWETRELDRGREIRVETPEEAKLAMDEQLYLRGELVRYHDVAGKASCGADHARPGKLVPSAYTKITLRHEPPTDPRPADAHTAIAVLYRRKSTRMAGPPASEEARRRRPYFQRVHEPDHLPVEKVAIPLFDSEEITLIRIYMKEGQFIQNPDPRDARTAAMQSNVVVDLTHGCP
jgi:hypothetical protein